MQSPLFSYHLSRKPTLGLQASERVYFKTRLLAHVYINLVILAVVK
jgi:hypothetical protein